MVVERRRAEGEKDHLRWYCEKCGEILHDSNFQLVDLGKQLKPIIQDFYANEALRTCKKCGTVMQVPPAPAPAAAK
jgi:3-hydroxyanthranilate 3,4-dioxygenase